ncbi:TadA family conjugal transfer-associated ATPase [Gephyromycinifex aptenodytis]|uniref:TadA family conjugal transfer-associated ATPase n=1 Tax=Gephyromycinifex aptenodytis TaxID=2716227 RepID=UPI00144685B3|nr:TadA family conjugal transfer-associated ATPase [Gephyromycinifex aptenodytis]
MPLKSEAATVLPADPSAEARNALHPGLLVAGPLCRWLSAPDVTDVLVNGTRGVWIERGRGLERVRCELGDLEALRRLAVRLAGLAGRRLDEVSPYVDGQLPGGIRLHALLPPLVENGAHISLRIARQLAPSLDDMRAWGAFDAEAQQILGALVAARVSFVVSGGTGSGKTTLLAALLRQVPPTERLVVVEDVRELAIGHPHQVRLQARPANIEGRGEVDLATLVRQALRMRPDRIVIGEVRGAEVRDLLAALNTGHEGGCGTIHANAPQDVVSRFEALGALAGLSPQATRTQLRSAVRVVLHLRRLAELRVLDSVSLLLPAAELQVSPALQRCSAGHLLPGPALGELHALLAGAGER